MSTHVRPAAPGGQHQVVLPPAPRVNVQIHVSELPGEVPGMEMELRDHEGSERGFHPNITGNHTRAALAATRQGEGE